VAITTGLPNIRWSCRSYLHPVVRFSAAQLSALGRHIHSPSRMTIRSEALRWLRAQGVQGGHIVASKRYAPDESWTKEKAWWVQVPLSVVDAGETVHIVCEAQPGARTFRHLKVPGSFFQQHLDDFATIGEDRINLFLAAEPGIEFEDQRGPGRISFARFEQHGSAA